MPFVMWLNACAAGQGALEEVIEVNFSDGSYSHKSVKSNQF